MFQDKPFDIINNQNKFGEREVGITHPDKHGFIKIADNGDIQIMAAEGLGIIISASQRCIFLVGDVVKFLTKEDEGLRFNNLAFNAKATTYSEPALIHPKIMTSDLYNNTSRFLD